MDGPQTNWMLHLSYVGMPLLHKLSQGARIGPETNHVSAVVIW